MTNICLKRVLIYAMNVGLPLLLLSGCQNVKTETNATAPDQLKEFLAAGLPTSLVKPVVKRIPNKGKVAVNVSDRRIEVGDKNLCTAQDITYQATVLENVSAPEDYGLDDRYNIVSSEFKKLSESCLGGSKVSCRTIQTSAVKWANASQLDRPRATDGGI